MVSIEGANMGGRTWVKISEVTSGEWASEGGVRPVHMAGGGSSPHP